jgi:hypothetical protein
VEDYGNLRDVATFILGEQQGKLEKITLKYNSFTIQPIFSNCILID